MRIHTYTLIVLLLAAPAAAQQAVQPVPDALSYGTAAINPAIAAYKALKSSNKPCALSRLAVSELIGNGVSIGIKRWRYGHADAVRPCLGCDPDGAESGHSMNGAIGAFSSGWGIAFALPTPFLRVEAHRHTKKQAVLGTLLGLGADALGHVIVRCDP